MNAAILNSAILFAQAEATEQSWLFWYFNACTPLFAILFILVSIAFVTLAIMNWLAISRNALVPPEMIEQFHAKCEAKEYQEAYEIAKESDSVLGKILAIGLVKMSDDIATAEQTMNDTAEEEVMRLEHRLSYISTIATVSPMLGLLGTVVGMIGAFDVIAKGVPQADKIADKIALALTTTEIGLLIAIPALIFYEIFKNRLAQFVLELDIQTAQVIKQFKPS